MQYFGDFIAHPEHEINIVNKPLVIIQLGKFIKIEAAFLSLKRKTKLILISNLHGGHPSDLCSAVSI
jgi:hypothetical protein